MVNGFAVGVLLYKTTNIVFFLGLSLTLVSILEILRSLYEFGTFRSLVHSFLLVLFSVTHRFLL